MAKVNVFTAHKYLTSSLVWHYFWDLRLSILANITNMWLGKYSAKRQLETIEETNKKEKLDDGVKVLSSWGNIFHNFRIIWL